MCRGSEGKTWEITDLRILTRNVFDPRPPHSQDIVDEGELQIC